jgi:hypothetical protein
MSTLPLPFPRLAAVAGIALLAVALDVRAAAAQSPERDYAAIGALQQRVDAYAAMQRALAASLPPFGSRADRQSLAVARRFLSSAIRAARPNARQGDVFTSEAARVIRSIIAAATSPVDSLFVPLMDESGRLMPGNHPRIHEPFPFWETRQLPASTLLMLPTLPQELEYRVVDYDLVLWDVYADLIVDVLPCAFGHAHGDVMFR